MRFRIRKRIFALALALVILTIAVETFAGSRPPGPGNVFSCASGRKLCTFGDPHGNITQINSNQAFYYNGSDTPSNNTIKFDVLGIEGTEPSGGLVYNVTTTGALSVVFIGAQPTRVTCQSCTASYSGLNEKISYSGSVSEKLVVVWAGLSLLTEPGVPSTLFKDVFLYTNPYLTNAWTFDRFGSTDPTPITQGGLMSETSISGTTQSVHVTSSSFNPLTSTLSANTIVKRKLTIALVPFAQKVISATGNLHAGLSTIVGVGAFPGASPAGSPTVANNDGCNTFDTGSSLNDNIGSAYFYADNRGYFEGDICGDPAGSKNIYPFYTTDPTLFTVFTIETRGVWCPTCADNALIGSSWVYFRIYQQDKLGNIIASSDRNVNVTGLTSGVLAPLAEPTYIFFSQRNAATSGIISKVALVELQNFGSPVLLPPPPSNIPFPTCGTLACPGIQPLIVLLSGFAGNGNPQIGAMIVYFIVLGLTAFGVAVKSRATIPAITLSILVTLMFIYGGFLPTFLDFIMLFGAGLLIAITILRFVGIGVGANPQAEGED